MSSVRDPIAVWRGRTRLVWLAAAPAVVAAWAWAVFVPSWAGVEVPEIGAPGVESGPVASAIDESVFDVVLWVEPPAPVVAAAPDPAPPPPPPIALRLVAIVRASGADGVGGPRAAIYDPGADELRVVGDGERIGGCTVVRVGERSAVVRAGAREATLALEGGR